MSDLLGLVLLALLAPGLVLALALRVHERRGGRWVLFAVACLLTAWAWPRHDLTLETLKRLKLVLALGAMGVAGHEVWRRRAATTPSVLPLVFIAGASLAAWANFGSFHGQRTWLHLHDVLHYHLGSKYFAEVGYTDLYTAMLRAEAEAYDDHFRTLEARDLATYEMVPIQRLLRRSEEVKQRFTPWRWGEFRRDVAFYRERHPPLMASVYLDHGYNASPLWTLLGGGLTRLVPAGSERGLVLLGLLDPLLLLLLFGSLAWAWGTRACLWALTHFCLLFGADFSWIGGSLLRYLWLAALGGAVACLTRRRHLVAGALMSLAAGLTIFPVFFALPVLMRAAWARHRCGRLPRRYRRFLLGLSAAGIVLLGATAFGPRGLGAWNEFRVNTSAHARVLAPNLIGLPEVLAFEPWLPDKLDRAQLDARQAHRRYAQWLALVLVLPTLSWLALRRVRGLDDASAALWGLPLVHGSLVLAG